MKTRLSSTRLVAVVGAIFCLPLGLAADLNQTSDQAPAAAGVVETGSASLNSSSSAQPSVAAAAVESGAPAAPAAPATPAPATPATVKLPYGVDDVLKLSRAQVSEDVTLNYIQNSGTIYGLSAKDIVYLKNEGVSDKVINAMQDQRKRATQAVAQTLVTTMPAVQVYTGSTTASAAPAYAQQPIYVQEPAYYEPIAVSEPEYTPASSVYVIPYSSQIYPRYTYASSYPSYGYYGSYGVYGGPAPFLPGPTYGAASFGPARRGGPGGVYHFGGGRPAGGGHPAGGSRSGGGGSHSGHHR